MNKTKTDLMELAIAMKEISVQIKRKLESLDKRIMLIEKELRTIIK